ncbi:lipoprotein signal peptidase [Cytophagaceae bacterium ABcell3]|nr:lipoprotein signal peptidase [Cytophagaceae bacterium ABcell3]
MKYTKYYLLSLGIILVDQVVKLLVHHHMFLGYEIPIFGDWFKLHYTENPGMAFGLEIAGRYGKLVLSIFRLFAMVGIAYYLYTLAKKHVHPGLLWSIALILGGAIGNVVDSTFYGVLLGNAPADAPTPWFHGQVIDMFFIDICNCWIPEWVPFLGGQYYPLWPIFNVADAAIFVGVVVILVMQKKFFAEAEQSNENEKANE